MKFLYKKKVVQEIEEVTERTRYDLFKKCCTKMSNRDE